MEKFRCENHGMRCSAYGNYESWWVVHIISLLHPRFILRTLHTKNIHIILYSSISGKERKKKNEKIIYVYIYIFAGWPICTSRNTLVTQFTALSTYLVFSFICCFQVSTTFCLIRLSFFISCFCFLFSLVVSVLLAVVSR